LWWWRYFTIDIHLEKPVTGTAKSSSQKSKLELKSNGYLESVLGLLVTVTMVRHTVISTMFAVLGNSLSASGTFLAVVSNCTLQNTQLYIGVFCSCIDGYSRKILWLKASSSNHNPAVIASYFMSAVDQYGGYPAHVRTDCGTENVTIAAIQASVTHAASSHIYGTSPGNQRIECWWSFFRRNRSQWWINLFEDLMHFGAYDPSVPKHVDCLRFCFMHVIQIDLDDVRRAWNTHRIRPSRDARCPAGLPDELFYLPPPPAVDCMIRNAPPLPAEVTDELEEPRVCDTDDLQDYFIYLCNMYGWHHPPVDVNAASELYFNIVRFL